MQIEVVDSRKTLGQRVQAYLRWRFGRDAAKQAAAITGADLRTAHGWVSEGREPKGEALLAIITDMGRDGLLAMFSAEVEDHEERLQRQINDLREEAARLEARLSKGRAPAADHVDGVASESAQGQRINQNQFRRGPARPGAQDE
jgi:hypothetical protein